MATGSARRKKREAASNRGGHREGTPGKSYANRSDLNQPIRTVPSQVYGQATAQARAQQAVPLPSSPAAPAPGGGTGAPTSPGALPTGPPPVQPGGLGPLAAPTNRPGEPITAGLPTGAGAGPEALGGGAALAPVDEVRAMYAAYPTDDMRRLLAYIEGY